MKNVKSSLLLVLTLINCSISISIHANAFKPPKTAKPKAVSKSKDLDPGHPSTIAATPGDNSIQVDILKVDISLERNILGIKSFTPPSEPKALRTTIGYEYIVTDKFNYTHDVTFYDDYCFTKKQTKSSIEYDFDHDPRKNTKAKKSKDPVLTVEFKTEQDANHLIVKELEPKGIIECKKAGKKKKK